MTSAPERPDANAVSAATRAGTHSRLDTAQSRSGAHDLRGTLPLRVELARQVRRRRTQAVAILVLVLPVLIALAFRIGGTGDDTGGGPALLQVATSGAGNFALFTEYVSVGFLLVVMVALFCGDSVASEASWSSLRYLLAIPVPRARLLRQKLIIALLLSFAAQLLLPLWAFLVGGAFFGWAPVESPLGGSFGWGEALSRLLIVLAYSCGQSLVVAGLAFLLGVLTDAPLGAVGGSVMLVIVSNILDSITALDPYRQFLPTHFQYSWVDALGPEVVWDDMMRGTGLALVYSAIFFATAWLAFDRKDITS
ncbi:MAG: transporter integral rane protein [Jatrophihabitantaceae bacterium]|nr:transporter integral rane protein [Jatrophihabitantaceae bacterium]